MPSSRTWPQMEDVRVGMRVKHQKFGAGTIIAVEFLGSLSTVVVKFDDFSVGEKRLVLGVAPLELLTQATEEIPNDPKACLRIIQALKAGRAPREGIRFLSVGIEEIVEQLQQAFDQASQHSPQTFWLIGDYGEGKSHMLRLIAALAEEQGFAWAYVVHDKDQLIGFHKPSYLFRRLLFELQWSNPDLCLDEFFEREEREIEEICDDLRDDYPRSWQERAEYIYDRNMRSRLVDRLAEIAVRLHDDKYHGLVICIDELENCCQLHWNQHRPAYETLSRLIHPSNCPLILCFGLTESGLESLEMLWRYYVSDKAGQFLSSISSSEAIEMPSLTDEHALELAKRIFQLHASAFDWQPTVEVQKIAQHALEVAKRNSSGQWRTFVQSVVTQLEVAYQKVHLYQPSTFPPSPPPSPPKPTPRIKLRLSVQPPTPKLPVLQVGDRVEIIKGPFRGWRGTVERVKDLKAEIMLGGPNAMRIWQPLDALKKLR